MTDIRRLELLCGNKKVLRKRLADPAFRTDADNIAKQIEDINMELWANGYHCDGEYILVKMHYPRRNALPTMTKLERAIWDVKQLVDKGPADPLLTEAIILLGQAQAKVADYYDAQLKKFKEKLDENNSSSSAVETVREDGSVSDG